MAIKFQDLPEYQEELREQITSNTSNNTLDYSHQQYLNMVNVTNKTHSSASK